MYVYIVIGFIMVAYSGFRLFESGKWTVESTIYHPAWWFAEILCIMIWPLIFLLAVHDIIKLYVLD